MVKISKTPIIILGAVSLGFLIAQISTLIKQDKPEDNLLANLEVVKADETVVALPGTVGVLEKAGGLNPTNTIEAGAGGPADSSTVEASLSETKETPPADQSEEETKSKNEGDSEEKSLKTSGEAIETKKPKAKAKVSEKNGEQPRVDELGFEIVDNSAADFAEVENRLLALEQAFSVDGRRNKGRGSDGNWEGDDEISRITDSLSNLYEIVEQLPSIDTLQAKMNAVDKAIVEMNDTIEAINIVAKKMQGAEIDGALKASGAAVEAANEALGEVKKIGDTVSKLEKGEEIKEALAEVKRIGDEVSKLEKGEETKEALSEFSRKSEEISKMAALLEQKIKSVESTITPLKEEIQALHAKQEGTAKNIGLLDKNIQVLSSSYKMVYENALRVDARLSSLEGDSEKVEKRVSLLEINLLPPD